MLVRAGAQALLLDAGTGVSRLVARPALLEGVRRLDVLLTHFHLDHVVGLAYLPALGLPSPLNVWGAGSRLSRVPTAELLDRLLARPLFPAPLRAAVHELEPGETRIGRLRVDLRVQPAHGDATLGVRIGGLVYCTDTGYDVETIAFARGAAALLHDAWQPTAGEPGHASAAEAAAIAAAADAERLVLIHVHPLLGSDRPLVAAARKHFAATTVGRDGDVVLDDRAG